MLPAARFPKSRPPGSAAAFAASAPSRGHEPALPPICVSPEAALGGPLGVVKEGDEIEIDIPNHAVNAKVSEEEFAKRRAAFVPHEPKVKTGWLSRYARLVSSANKGAVLE